MAHVTVSIGSDGHLHFRGGTAKQRQSAREAVKKSVERAMDRMMAPETKTFTTECRGCGCLYNLMLDLEDLRGKKTYTSECPKCGRSNRKKIKY